MSDHLKPIIEALIFASPEPITPKTLYKLLDGEPREDVQAALEDFKLVLQTLGDDLVAEQQEVLGFPKAQAAAAGRPAGCWSESNRSC